jgi:phage baseplate assembly protein W
MNQNVPVGIVFPYSRGDSGFFKQTYSDLERAVTNLKMLLMTSKGERPLMPTYGSELKEILFDNNTTDGIDDLLEDAVKDAVDSWMPEVFIEYVLINRDLINEPSTATLEIKFRLLNIPDSIQLLNLEISP